MKSYKILLTLYLVIVSFMILIASNVRDETKTEDTQIHTRPTLRAELDDLMGGIADNDGCFDEQPPHTASELNQMRKELELGR
jgi:hypothetical protein